MKNQDNIIFDNATALRERLNTTSPGLLKEEMQKLLQRKNCTDTQFFLNKQWMIDDLSDFLANNHIVNILYARRTAEKKCYEVIAYSMPCDGEMFVIKLSSQMYGVVSTLNVSFYMSLETMFLDLRTLYQSLNNDNWVLLEKQKPYILFAHFN